MSEAAVQGKADKVPGVRFYVIRNILKDKASGGGLAPGDKGGISVEAIQAAEAETGMNSSSRAQGFSSLVPRRVRRLCPVLPNPTKRGSRSRMKMNRYIRYQR